MRLPKLLLAVVMALAGCTPGAAIPATPGDEAESVRLLAALGDARARWADRAPADYTFTESCPGCEGQIVAVRSGEIVSLSGPDQPTVEQLFGQIEAAVEAGASVEVAYDDALGYPTTVTIDSDRDGAPEVDHRYSDLEAMPIVGTLAELLQAQARWEALGLDDYQYLFRADCTCPEGGTWLVTVVDGRVTEEVPIDDDARRSSQISPGSLDAAFRDLEDWFADSSGLIDEGILEVDVRMDPDLGYPRWFRVVAEGLEADGPLTERFEIIVTTELIGPVEVVNAVDAGDREALAAAMARWERAGLTDYRFEVEYHCNCPPEFRGPFMVTIRGGEFWSAVAPEGEGFGDAALYDAITIEQVFDLIEGAVRDGTDVDVTYDEVTGQPLTVIIDPEAVAVDGGLAFTMTPVVVIDPEATG